MGYYGPGVGDSYQITDSDGDTLIRVENPEGADNDEIEMIVANDRKVFITSTDGYVNGETPMTINLGGTATLSTQWLVRKDDSDTSVGIGTLSHSDTAGRGGVLFAGRTRGTESTPTATQDGDSLFDYAALGHDGTDFNLASRLTFYQNGAGATGSTPGGLTFNFTKPGDNNVTEFMDVSHEGLVVNDGGESFVYRMETSGDTHAVYSDGTNDTIAFGSDQPTLTINGLTVIPKVLVKDGAGNSNISFVTQSDSDVATQGAFCVFARSRSGLTAVQNGDRVGVFRADAHTGTDFRTGAAMQFLVEGTPTATNVPTQIAWTTDDGTSGNQTRMVLRANGYLGVGAPFPLGQLDVRGGTAFFNYNQDATSDFNVYGQNGRMFFIDADQGRHRFGDTTTGELLELWTTKTEFNRLQADIDFIVNSNGSADLFRTNSGNNSVGINVNPDTSARFMVNGSRGLKVDTLNAATLTLDDTQEVIAVSYTSTGAVTITLPSAGSCWQGTNGMGRTYIVKDAGCNAAANNITINTAGADTITTTTTGNTSVVINGNGNSIRLTAISSNTWMLH